MHFYTKKLMATSFLPWKEIDQNHRDLFLKQLSGSHDYDLLINDHDIEDGNTYQWLGSIFHIKKTSDREKSYDLSFPEITITEDQIEAIVIPEDFWYKWRFMRFDSYEYKTYGKIGKIIISPGFIVEFSHGVRKSLYKLEKGFRRIMQKRKVIQKKFDKQKKINMEHAKPGTHDLILILDHLKPDFNIGKIFRTSEIFSIREIHVIGTSFFDPTTAMGGLKRVKARFFENFDDSYNRLKDEEYNIYCLDSKTDNHLHEVKLQQKTAFILGHEEFGPQFERENYPEIKNIKIKQFGVTESLNVSVAASIATYEYIRQVYL